MTKQTTPRKDANCPRALPLATGMTITRPRKQRIMEKAGLRFVAAWLPFAVADALQPEIDAADKIAVAALNNVEQRT